MNNRHSVQSSKVARTVSYQRFQKSLSSERERLQQQLIEAQQKIIELQQRIDALTPKSVADEEVFWHIASGGILSEEAANSQDLKLVLKFRAWNVGFAVKYLKPYLNPSVYGECLNQMTRGLNTRIVELETKQSFEREENPAPQIVSNKPQVRPKGSRLANVR